MMNADQRELEDFFWQGMSYLDVEISDARLKDRRDNAERLRIARSVMIRIHDAWKNELRRTDNAT